MKNYQATGGLCFSNSPYNNTGCQLRKCLQARNIRDKDGELQQDVIIFGVVVDLDPHCEF